MIDQQAGGREGTNVGRAWWFKEGALHGREGIRANLPMTKLRGEKFLIFI